jgi:hypothetical protein
MYQMRQFLMRLESKGHGFSRAVKDRAEGASALPKAGVQRSGTTNLLFSIPPQL